MCAWCVQREGCRMDTIESRHIHDFSCSRLTYAYKMMDKAYQSGATASSAIADGMLGS